DHVEHRRPGPHAGAPLRTRAGQPQRGAAGGTGPPGHLPAARRPGHPRRRRRLVRREARRGRRHRRGVRQRQVGHLDGGDGAAAQPGRPGRRPGPLPRGGPADHAGLPAVGPPRAGAGHGLPGPDELAQPGRPGRHPGDRGAAAAPGHQPVGGPRRGRGPAATLRHPRPSASTPGVPAPAVGRHAPARPDRHRAGLQAGAADLRRAHHRPGRHHPGAGAGAAQGAGSRPRHGDGDDHPRPRGRGRAVRPRQRHVRRPRGRVRAPPGAVRAPAAPLHRGPAQLHPAAGRAARGAAAAHPRNAARRHRLGSGLRLRAPLPARGRGLHRARPGVGADGPARPPGPLRPPRSRAGRGEHSGGLAWL
ncbi:MAG: Oligopeptide transport ATP-binding protein OppD, partial [uncultured Friedmanniella sp.]